MATNVPDLQFTLTGLVLPVESDILAGVQQDQNNAFGGNLNLDLTEPQGQIATSNSAIIANKNDQFALFVNGVDPATSSGFMQDGIGKIYFLDRIAATSTTVPVIFSGKTDTFIPVGSTVKDSSGNVFSTTDSGTILDSGTVTLTVAALVTGPINVAPGAITTIVRSIPGLDRVSNIDTGVTGRDLENRADFEYRRKNSVALNAVGSLPSIYAAVFSVANVSDVYIDENVTDTTITKNGVTLLPHSIYVAVVGGLSLEIATAIWKKKSVGANYNGNTSVQVVDSSSYNPPYPAYTVKFQIPDTQPVLFDVQIANSSSLPSDIIAQVKTAIISAFNGLDGGIRARIGSKIFASRFYAPVSAISPSNVEIMSILIGTTSATQNFVTIDAAHVPTVTAANISVELI